MLLADEESGALSMRLEVAAQFLSRRTRQSFSAPVEKVGWLVRKSPVFFTYKAEL